MSVNGPSGVRKLWNFFSVARFTKKEILSEESECGVVDGNSKISVHHYRPKEPQVKPLIYQTGLPFLSRNTNVSSPRLTSRAKIVSTPSNFTFDPVTSS